MLIVGWSMVHYADRLLRWYFCGDNRRRSRNDDHLLGVRSLEFPQRYGIHVGQEIRFLLAILLARNHTFTHDCYIDLHVCHLWVTHVWWCTVSRLCLRSVKFFRFYNFMYMYIYLIYTCIRLSKHFYCRVWKSQILLRTTSHLKIIIAE